MCMDKGVSHSEQALQSYVVGASVRSARRKVKKSETPFPQQKAQPTLTRAKQKAGVSKAFRLALCLGSQLPFLIVSVR